MDERIYSEMAALEQRHWWFVARRKILDKLISEEFFDASKFNVPDIHFEKWDKEIDHDWHEFIDVTETSETHNSGDINDFLIRIEKIIKLPWE